MNFTLYSDHELASMHRMAKQHWQHRMDRVLVATARYQEINAEMNRRGIP